MAGCDHILVFSEFTFKPMSLLAFMKISAFSLTVCKFSPSILTSSAYTRSWYFPFNSKHILFSWTLLMAYYRAKLKSKGGSASPWLEPQWIGKASENATKLNNWLSMNPEVHYRPYISPPLVPISSKFHPVSSIRTFGLQIHFILSSHLHLGLPKGLFPSDLSTKTLYDFMDYSIRTTCPAHLSPLD